jgi:hypothetical protein
MMVIKCVSTKNESAKGWGERGVSGEERGWGKQRFDVILTGLYLMHCKTVNPL